MEVQRSSDLVRVSLRSTNSADLSEARAVRGLRRLSTFLKRTVKSVSRARFGGSPLPPLVEVLEATHAETLLLSQSSRSMHKV